MSKDDIQLLSALALALTRYPRSTLQQLATHAGISKATLYRMARTREEVVERIVAHASGALADAFDNASLEDQPPLQALHKLTTALLDIRQFFSFLLMNHWLTHMDRGQDPHETEECQHYIRRVHAFFQRGQEEGVFRADVPSLWLARSYDFLLFSMMESEQRGDIEPDAMVGLVEQLFLGGALAKQA